VVFETLLSIGTIESVTLVESLSVEITGPLLTNIGGSIALSGGIGGAILLVGGVEYVVIDWE